MGESDQPRRKVMLSFDLRAVCVILLLVIIGLVIWCRPWERVAGGEVRKITITGEATIKAEPDEYTFNPMWEKATLEEITAQNDTVVTELKKLGVADKDIKNNASAWQDYQPVVMPVEPGQPEKTYNRQLTITITVDNKELAQKVQDYLVKTDPVGSITPYPQFSTAKQKELEDRARTDAIADARKRAETSASELGDKVGKVLEVSEGSGGGGCGYSGLCYGAPMATDAKSAERSSLTVQPGEDEFTYSVQVIFELK